MTEHESNSWFSEVQRWAINDNNDQIISLKWNKNFINFLSELVLKSKVERANNRLK